MLRLTLAVAAGLLTLSVLVVVTELLLLKFLFAAARVEIGRGELPPAYLLAIAASHLVYAVIAGCLTAAIARKFEAPTILGALLLGMGVGSLLLNRGGQPVWFAAVAPMAAAVAATTAGYRWLGRQG
jgi:hypothetical protein